MLIRIRQSGIKDLFMAKQSRVSYISKSYLNLYIQRYVVYFIRFLLLTQRQDQFELQYKGRMNSIAL